MQRLPRYLALSLITLGSLLAIPATASDSDDLLEQARRVNKNAMEVYYSALGGGKLDFEKAWKVGPKTLDMAWATLKIEGGWIVPVVPKELSDDEKAKLEGLVEGDLPVSSAIYVGKGSFAYTAPHETERWLLNYSLSEINNKYSDVDGLDIALNGGTSMFFQGKWLELLQEGGEVGTPDKKTKKAAEKLWNKRGDLFQGGVAYAATWDEFAGNDEDSLTLDLPTKDIKGVPYLTYSDDRGETEAMSLGVYKRYALNRDSIRSWSLGSWFSPDMVQPAGEESKRSDRDLGYERIRKHNLDIHHYDMNMVVYRDDDEGQWGMQVDGTVEIEIIRDGVQALELAMMNYGENEFDPNSDPDIEKRSGSNKVKVGKVELDGNQLEFLHKQHNLVVQLPRQYKKGEKLKLGFSYSGLFIMTIKQPAPQTELSMSGSVGAIGSIINWRVPNDYPWFPQGHSHSDSFTFDWNLKLPYPKVAATSGTLLSMEEEDGFIVHVIKEQTPVTFPAMLFGRLSILENDPDYEAGEYKIRIYVHPGFEKDAETFIDEAAAVIRFYEQRFGKYPFQELDIAQMPIGTGYAQAPAGLIQMDGYTYISKTDLVNLYNANDRMLDIRDNFVPHEIAHEWWGHKAGWGSSRDQWVSETFAEYSAALFIEERERQKSGDANDVSGYETRKDRWGANGRLGHTFKRTGPIWIGNRVGARRTASIYARGPLVLDLLRQELGKEVVLKMMYAWCELAAMNDGKVVTEDLEVILKKIVPAFDFSEFMRRYVKGNEPLPTDPKGSKAADLGQAKY